MAERPRNALPEPTGEVDRLAADLERFGYGLIADALTPAQVAAMRSRMEEQAAAERALGYEDRDETSAEGGFEQHVPMLVNKGRVFWDLLSHPSARALVRHVLGRAWQLSAMIGHVTHPGGTPTPMRIDQWWLPHPAPPTVPHARAGRAPHAPVAEPSAAVQPISPAVVVHLVWLLSDFTAEAEAARIIPGSHLSGARPDPAQPIWAQAVPVLGPSGTALVWEGRTWHASGVNRSNRPRTSVHTLYCGPQFRTLENYTLGTRPELLAEMPDDLKRVLGFGIWSSYGKTQDGRAALAVPGEQTIGELRVPEGGAKS